MTKNEKQIKKLKHIEQWIMHKVEIDNKVLELEKLISAKQEHLASAIASAAFLAKEIQWDVDKAKRMGISEQMIATCVAVAYEDAFDTELPRKTRASRACLENLENMVA